MLLLQLNESKDQAHTGHEHGPIKAKSLDAPAYLIWHNIVENLKPQKETI